MDTAAESEAARLAGASFDASRAAAGGGGEPNAHDASLIDAFERVLATLRRMVSNYTTLAVLDLQRSAVQLAWLVAAGILIAVLVVTAWLAGVVALAVLLLREGLSWPGVLGVAALLNIVGAALVLWRMRAVFEHSPFSATLRQFRAEPQTLQKGKP